jgi:UDP-glucose 4-epimerase
LSLTLVTGAGGYIGAALLGELTKAGVPVVGLSRQEGCGLDVLKGDFASPEDLRVLDGLEIGRVCHLAAVTGGCSEEDGLRVNVLGTRSLMRYLVDRGCRKFVLASSIAAVGVADSDFSPQAVPIPDEHPCLARDAYGLSKYLMEEMSRYFERAHNDLEITALRLCSIFPSPELPPKVSSVERPASYALASITKMALADAVAAFRLALDTDLGAGFRIFNAGPQKAWTDVPVADLLRPWLDGRASTLYYQDGPHAFDSVFDVSAIAGKLGFVASV